MLGALDRKNGDRKTGDRALFSIKYQINISESIILTAEGFDADNNELEITPIWTINGGGIIDNNGKFIATTLGEWQVSATLDGISNNATIIVQQKDIGKINDEDGKEKGIDKLILFLIIGVIIAIIIIALLFFFVFKKKLKKDEIKKDEKPIENKNVQYQIQQPSQPPQYQETQQIQTQYQITHHKIQKQNEGMSPSKKINQE